jgi:8-oxo-dGTP pyrophosphatase MutT (NUDIX family)
VLVEAFDPVKGETFYRPLGGGVEFGETSAAAAREIREEVSADVTDTELRPNEFMEFRLPPGNYVIEYAALESTYVGCFHRFTPTAGAARSAA